MAWVDARGRAPGAVAVDDRVAAAEPGGSTSPPPTATQNVPVVHETDSELKTGSIVTGADQPVAASACDGANAASIDHPSTSATVITAARATRIIDAWTRRRGRGDSISTAEPPWDLGRSLVGTATG